MVTLRFRLINCARCYVKKNRRYHVYFQDKALESTGKYKYSPSSPYFCSRLNNFDQGWTRGGTIAVSNPRDRRSVGKKVQNSQHLLSKIAGPFWKSEDKAGRAIKLPLSSFTTEIVQSKLHSPETKRGMGTRFQRNDSWDRLGGEALLMIG